MITLGFKCHYPPAEVAPHALHSQAQPAAERDLLRLWVVFRQLRASLLQPAQVAASRALLLVRQTPLAPVRHAKVSLRHHVAWAVSPPSDWRDTVDTTGSAMIIFFKLDNGPGLLLTLGCRSQSGPPREPRSTARHPCAPHTTQDCSQCKG